MKLYYNSKLVNEASTDYVDAIHKPQINGVDIVGNMTTEDAGITWFGTQVEYDALTSIDPNTLYVIDDGIAAFTTNNYLDVVNKPSVNGVELTGNKTLADLNMYSKDQIDKMFASSKSIEVVEIKPTSPVPGVIYYVGPDYLGYYNIYVYDDAGTEIPMGTTKGEVYTAGDGITLASNEFSVNIDGDTITLNTDRQLKVDVFTGATSTADGTGGLVPYPEKSSQEKFLCGNGEWESIFDIIYPVGSLYIAMSATTTPPGQGTYCTWTPIRTGVTLWSTTDVDEIGYYISAGLPAPQFQKVGAHTHELGRAGSHSHTLGVSQGKDATAKSTQYVRRSGDKDLATTSFTTGLDGEHNHAIEAGGEHTPTIITSEGLYGKSTTVQPPAIKVVMWKRTA